MRSLLQRRTCCARPSFYANCTLLQRRQHTAVDPASSAKEAAPAERRPEEVFPESTASNDLEIDEDGFPKVSVSRLPHDFGRNQLMSIDNNLRDHLRSTLWQFRGPTRIAIAYGSGIFKQKGYDTKERPMVDLMFGVTHAQHWHSLNLMQYPEHYSFYGHFGSRAVSYLQEHMGAHMYYNTYVSMNEMMLKYGVVTLRDLQRDLVEWETLYIAGRLHKPVKILRDTPEFRLNNQVNLISALRLALLLLPEQFTERELYCTVAGISYRGDFRMTVGENPRKVENIVDAQLEQFRRLYEPLIQQLPNLAPLGPHALEGDGSAKLQQDMAPKRRGNMVHRLPKKFRARLYSGFERVIRLSNEQREELSLTGAGASSADITMALHDQLVPQLHRAIAATVGWSSTMQSLKGLITAGPFKSMTYAGAKLGKWSRG